MQNQEKKLIQSSLSASWKFIGVKKSRLFLIQFFSGNIARWYQSYYFFEYSFNPTLFFLCLGFQCHEYWILHYCPTGFWGSNFCSSLFSPLFWLGTNDSFYPLSSLTHSILCHLHYLVHSLNFKNLCYCIFRFYNFHLVLLYNSFFLRFANF